MATAKAIFKNGIIYIRYYHNDKKAEFTTNVKVDESGWDDAAGRIRKGVKNYTTYNLDIENKKNDIMRVATELRSAGMEPDVHNVKYKVSNKVTKKSSAKNKTTEDLLDEWIQDAKLIKAAKTIETYEYLKTMLNKFTADHIPAVTLMNGEFALSLTKYMIEKEYRNNSISGTIKNLKVFMKWCVKKGYSSNVSYIDFHKPTETNYVVYVTDEELKRIMKLKLKRGSDLYNARNNYLFQCYSGLRASDVNNLVSCNIVGDMIEITVKKKKELAYIPMTPVIRKILTELGSDFVYIPKKKYNTLIKKLAEEAKINEIYTLVRHSGQERKEIKKPKYEFITSHTGRKTFISLSHKKGMRDTSIMSVANIKSMQTMMKYKGTNEKDVIDDMKKAWG